MDQEPKALVTRQLSDRELAAYEFVVDHKMPKVAPTKMGEFYQLYLNGKTCEEIARLNPGFSLGQIVRCRIEDIWDERKDHHLAELLDGIRDKVQQNVLENVSFLTDVLTAFRKLHGDKVARYIQTGKIEDLGDSLSIVLSMKNFKSISELLLKMTGQDKQKSEVQHTIVQQPVPIASQALTVDQAAEILKIVDSKEKK